jgi:hypothetical protein
MADARRLILGYPSRIRDRDGLNLPPIGESDLCHRIAPKAVIVPKMRPQLSPVEAVLVRPYQKTWPALKHSRMPTL